MQVNAFIVFIVVLLPVNSSTFLSNGLYIFSKQLLPIIIILIIQVMLSLARLLILCSGAKLSQKFPTLCLYKRHVATNKVVPVIF